jgi:uncharacterized membrane protein
MKITTTNQLLEQHAKDLDKINNQRRIWLYASSVVMVGIVFIIFTWDWLDHFHSNQLWWLVISLMLIVSINWWYWTMRVIRILLQHQRVEYNLLHCILNEIELAKHELKGLVDQSVDITK